MTYRALRLGLFAVAALAVVVSARPAAARPTYFEVFTSRYGIDSSDRLYACGVCHYKWTGTGARNPFGTAVEQQLYVGKSITQALTDVESGDADGDGYTNVDEITNFRTLPGYSCNNYFDATGAPTGYDTYITPNVASCLEPLDIRVSPTSISTIANANDTVAIDLTVYNNGSTFPLNVSSYDLEPGTNAAFSISGPTAPFQIPVSGSVTIQVTFAPTSAVIASGTLRIVSDDPDESPLDVPMTAIGVSRTLAPADQRAACLRTVEAAYRRYGKTHLQQWGRCYAAEASGLGCDAGTRDLKIAKAEARLRTKVGGTADRRCGGAGLTPFILGYPTSCGGTCGGITVNSLSALDDCLVCRQTEVMNAALGASIGATPPDLPAPVGSAAAACGRRLIDGLASAVSGVQKALGRCELGNITAATPVLCASTESSDIAALQARADAQPLRCTDTTGLSGCLFGMSADPTCLGTTGATLGTTLTDAAVPQP
ncbi:MAG TPA: hypothetical protein VGK30_20685 [Candidatus Binatia bacterium]|jgi:hypothetical protein